MLRFPSKLDRNWQKHTFWFIWHSACEPKSIGGSSAHLSPNVRKLGHAPRSICETGVSGESHASYHSSGLTVGHTSHSLCETGVTGDSGQYYSDSIQGQYSVQPAVNTRLHPLTTCISTPSPATSRQAARRSSRRDSNPGQAMTPARSVPEMEVEPQITNVPYQQLDSRHLMGQLSYSQTASVTSDGSQVSSNLNTYVILL